MSKPPSQEAVVMPIYPAMGSIQDVLDYGESRLPITNKNDLRSLLRTMQNTVLVVQLKEQEKGS